MKPTLQLLIICSLLLNTLSVMACNETYKIDFSGQKGMYTTDIPKGHSQKLKGGKGKISSQDVFLGQPKDEYKADEEVVLYFFMVATDTKYTFYLDGNEIEPLYSNSRGFKISFLMPDHDVKLECVRSNTMIEESASPTYSDQ